ncbi:MAG TPA: cytochrome c [Xanthobacteraceae bacterium]|nr:cytochrome c [Xanthobacteraceae bacterium]
MTLPRMAAACLIAIIACGAPAVCQQPATVSTAVANQPPGDNPTRRDAAAIKEGRSLFNQTCAHCHGPDAVTGQSERNLRRLRARYRDEMPNVFRTTVIHGRPDKGMPVWGEILDETTVERIYGYLETVQDGPE